MSQNVAKKRIVYVVDDEPSVLQGIERVLKVHGFDVEGFGSAEDFRARAHLHDALCVVLDIQLSGMSGLELQRQLLSDGVSLPVIFVTADDSEVARRAARDLGCVAYLSKPFLAKSLIDAIARASISSTGA